MHFNSCADLYFIMPINTAHKKHPALARDRGVLDLKAGDDLLSHG
jgi:hypothetical protein